MNELKPCPFCRCTTINIILPNYEMQDYSAKSIASCNDCGAKTDLEQWNTRAPQSEWIGVEKEMSPSIGQDALILMEVGGNIEMGKYIGDGDFKANWCGRRGKNEAYKVTHWMPLPTLPKE